MAAFFTATMYALRGLVEPNIGAGSSGGNFTNTSTPRPSFPSTAPLSYSPPGWDSAGGANESAVRYGSQDRFSTSSSSSSSSSPDRSFNDQPYHTSLLSAQSSGLQSTYHPVPYTSPRGIGFNRNKAATLRAMRFESAWRRYVFVVGCFAVRVAEVIVDGSEAGERRNFFGDNSTNAGTSSSSSSSSPIGITPRRSFA